VKSIYIIGSLRNPETTIGNAIRQLGYDVSMTGTQLARQQTMNECGMKRAETIPMQRPSLDTLLVMFSVSINLISIAAMLPSLLFLEGNQRILNLVI
jgi:hypothetical protein